MYYDMITEYPKTNHRFSGWPGAWCLDCGSPDLTEECLAGNHVYPHYFSQVCENSKCPESEGLRQMGTLTITQVIKWQQAADAETGLAVSFDSSEPVSTLIVVQRGKLATYPTGKDAVRTIWLSEAEARALNTQLTQMFADIDAARKAVSDR